MRLFALLIGSLLIYSCNSDSSSRITGVQSTFLDTRDNKSYKTITLDANEWFAEDLTFENQSTYSQNEALQSCPEGWRLPTDNEWIRMLSSLGGFRNIDVELGGDLKGTFTSLVSSDLLNATANEQYWSSDPFWDGEWSQHAVAYNFHSQFEGDVPIEEVQRDTVLRNDKLRCRCIRGAQNSGDYIAITLNGEETIYDLNITSSSFLLDNVQDEGFAIIGFDTLDSNLTDKYAFISLPTNQQPLIFPVEMILVEVEIGEMDDSGTLFKRTAGVSDEMSTVQITLNSWNRREISGVITGFFIEPDTAYIQNSDFYVRFN